MKKAEVLCAVSLLCRYWHSEYWRGYQAVMCLSPKIDAGVRMTAPEGRMNIGMQGT